MNDIAPDLRRTSRYWSGVWTAGLVVLLACGCHDAARRRDSTQAGGKEGTMPTQMQAQAAVEMVQGPSIRPAAALLEWLEQNAVPKGGKRRRVRLPVVVAFEDAYRLAIGKAHVGMSEQDAGAEALPLSLDDTGLSVSLLSRLRDLCPPPQQACALWLEGYWGKLVDDGLPSLDPPGERRHPFAVLRIVGLVQAGDSPHVLIETPR